MSDLKPSGAEQVSTDLTSQQRLEAYRILANCPVVALPNGIHVRPVTTVEALLVHLGSIVDFLRNEMRDRLVANDELDAIKFDIKAAGRLFKLITQETETE